MFHFDSFSSFKILPYNQPPPKNEPVTLIIGAKCSNGVVMIADRKITHIYANNSIEYEYQNKLFGILSHIIIGSSGNTGMFDLFKLRSMEYVVKNTVTIESIISRLCDITKRTNEEYNYRYDTSFDVLVGIQYMDKNSELTYITHNGEPYSNRPCYTVGSGVSFARVFLKGINTENLTMRQFVEIGYFIIKYIEKTESDASVGIGYKHPQIWYIPNKYETDEKGNVVKNKDFEEKDV